MQTALIGHQQPSLIRQVGMSLSSFKIPFFGRKKYHPNMVRNFQNYGVEFGVYSMDDFDAMARKFYEEGLKSSDPLFTVILLPKHRCGIDYNGEYRGIYEPNGTPIAFFRPNFRQFGYRSKEEELNDWRSGKNAAYYE